MANGSREDKLFYCLAKISNLLSKQTKIESHDMKLIVELFFEQYLAFDVTMCFSVLKDIIDKLSE